MELLFFRFPKIPFTCSYLPGGAQIAVLWPVYVLGFGFFKFVAVNLGIWLQGGIRRVLYFYIVAAVLLLILIRRNIQPADEAIRFEETSEKALILLDLKN